ncbi:MAG: NAD-dependent epimerase/dehydratase family protein [Actinomycetota bacterium]
MGQRVLITGISGYLAGRFARRLEEDPGVDYIVGVDLEEPTLDLERTEYVRADIRNPLVVKVLQTTEVDTLVHLNILATPARMGGRSQMKEMNVIGTMQLFAACQRAERLRKVVMKSTTAIYGADARDPALFTEEMSARSSPKGGYGKDAVEVEQYARDFGRRRPDIGVTVLRFANFMGPGIETPFTKYFSLPVAPTAMGFDPRIQFVHEDDAVEILFRATREDHPGIFNVTADGVLLLSQAIRMVGKLPIPIVLPLARPVANLVRRFGLVDFATDQLQFLLYGRVAENARMKNRFGYEPEFTTRAALEDFLRGRKVRGLVSREQVADWEREVNAFLRRKRQEQFEGNPRG